MPFQLLITAVSLFCLIWINPTFSCGKAVAETAPAKNSADDRQSSPEEIKHQPLGPLIYWNQGLRIENRHRKWALKIAGKFIVDAGEINTHGGMTAAFADKAGSDIMFRRMTVSVAGNIGRRFDFKAEVDFSQIQDVMDNWIGLKKIPLIGRLTLGHQKEPFTLDWLTSTHSRTFMEQSLAGDALAPGRNIGILASRSVFNERMTWALGGFYNTGSFKNAGEAKDQLDKSNGYNITGRISGLPWYHPSGDRLVHLGLSYSYRVREDSEDDPGIQAKARPESRLTDTRWVNTGLFLSRQFNSSAAEIAMVRENFSFQAELYGSAFNAPEVNDPVLWGFYAYGSYFISGEHRVYDRTKGIFSRVIPRHVFKLNKGGWGAWELALRCSYVDLNSGRLRGGRENNWTLGLNWYLTRHVRFMLNGIHARVRDRQTPPAIDSGSADILQARFQVAF